MNFRDLFLGAVLALASTGAFAQVVTIPELPTASQVTGSEVVPCVQTGITSQCSLNQIDNLITRTSNTYSAPNTFNGALTFGGTVAGSGAFTLGQPTGGSCGSGCGNFAHLELNGVGVVAGQVNLATGVTGNLLMVNIDSGVNADTGHFLRGDGTWQVIPGGGGSGGAGGNPTACVGLTPVNGADLTFLRSDGAPPLCTNIAPSMTGAWNFTQPVTVSGGGSSILGTLNIAAPNTAGVTALNVNAVSGATGVFVAGTSSSSQTVPTAILSGPNGAASALALATGTSLRWDVLKGPTAETGANAGSNFGIVGFSDAGSPLGTPITITRSTGEISIAAPWSGSTSLQVAGGTILSGSLSVSGVATLGTTTIGGLTVTGTATAGNFSTSGTTTTNQLNVSGHITQGGGVANSFGTALTVAGGGIPITGASPGGSGFGSLPGWGPGMAIWTPTGTSNQNIWFLGEGTGAGTGDLQLWTYSDAPAIGHSAFNITRNGVAVSTWSIGNTADYPAINLEGNAALFFNGTAGLGLVPSNWPISGWAEDSQQWVTFTGSNAMQSAGETFSTGDARMMTFALNSSGKPTIRTMSGFEIDTSGGTMTFNGAPTVTGSFKVSSGLIYGSQTGSMLNDSGSSTLALASGYTQLNVGPPTGFSGTLTVLGKTTGQAFKPSYSHTGTVSMMVSSAGAENDATGLAIWGGNQFSENYDLFISRAGSALGFAGKGPNIAFDDGVAADFVSLEMGGGKLQINTATNAGVTGDGSQAWTIDQAGNTTQAGAATIKGHIVQSGGSTNTFSTGATFGAGIAIAGDETLTGGIVVDAASGGNKGAGTVNARGLYVNGTAVSTANGNPGYPPSQISLSGNYTLQAADCGHAVRYSGPSGNTITVPGLPSGCPVGSVVLVLADMGPGGTFINIANGSGLTLEWSSGSGALSNGEHKLASIGAAMIWYVQSNEAIVLPFSQQTTIQP